MKSPVQEHLHGGVTDHVLGFVATSLASCSYATCNSALAAELPSAGYFVPPKSLFLAHMQVYLYM